MEIATWRPLPDRWFSMGSKRNAMPGEGKAAAAELMAAQRLKAAFLIEPAVVAGAAMLLRGNMGWGAA